jgi:glycosyltransferase involved in cell wall biosynthesis
MREILFDERWIGSHGIGRFASEISQRLILHPLNIGGSPTAVFDIISLTLRLAFCKSIVFSPGFNAPLFGLERYVFTIHDLNHIDTASSLLKRLYYGLIMKKACSKVPFVLTVSEFSRQRIMTWAKLPSNRVINVGNGVSSIFSIDGDRFDPGYAYLLCIGNRKPHKNEARVVESFSKASIDPTIHLLFNGSPSDELLALARKHGVSERVDFLGKLDETTLASVYRGAIALVFPSLYEGFGLPVVEAMACGIPVITSNVTSLPEVGGDAVILVNPKSIDEITISIERIINDESLRMKLRASGLIRAKEFSWDSVAARVQCVLDSLNEELTN